MKYFCKKCGKINLYSSEIPKFCGYCGINFTSAINNNALNKDLNANENLEKTFENKTVINFKSIQPKFKIVNSDSMEPEKLKDMLEFSASTDGNKINFIDKNLENSQIPESLEKNTDLILEEFKRESSSCRPNFNSENVNI